MKTPTALFASLALASSLSAIESLESSFEYLDSDSFQVNLLSVRGSGTAGEWETEFNLARSEFDIDFRPAPFDLLGREAQLSEDTLSVAFRARRQTSERIKLDLAASYRDGFANYRSVWLDTYFDQHFSVLEGVPGFELYQNFQPTAYSFAAGLAWEYIPANATASLTVSRVQDNVSPGYEIDFEGVTRGELTLATTSASIVTENVLNKRLRSRLALSASETSARETRYSGEIALNAAIGEKLIWRNRFGYSEEAPLFEAKFFESTLERPITETISLYLTGRRYDDTGEIENALLFTTAAPGLRSDSLGIGLRFLGDKWTGRLSATHTEADYEPVGSNADFFQNLYVDEDWLNVQLAIGKTF